MNISFHRYFSITRCLDFKFSLVSITGGVSYIHTLRFVGSFIAFVYIEAIDNWITISDNSIDNLSQLHVYTLSVLKNVCTCKQWTYCINIHRQHNDSLHLVALHKYAIYLFIYLFITNIYTG